MEIEPLQTHFVRAANHIRRNAPLIKAIWEGEVRKKIANSNKQTSLALLNSLGVFLEDLATFVEQGYCSGSSEQIGEVSKEHGKIRAKFSGYFLPQLLKEFSILREVLTQHLHKAGLLTYEVRSIIDKDMDESISYAATEFASIQGKAVEDALAIAQRSNQSLENFAAIAAHDLKSPLATITSYLDILQEEYVDKKDAQHLRYINLSLGASERMRNLIDSLLSFAKLSIEKKKFQSRDLGIIVDLAQKNIADMISRNTVIIDVGPLPHVMGDSDLLTQLFQNLLVNAIKFKSARPPYIQIYSKEQEGHYLISVKDNGIGFDPKLKEEIFDLYKKLSGKYEGSGIGLATCKKILELHGGKIWAESTPGQGSVFTILLNK